MKWMMEFHSYVAIAMLQHTTRLQRQSAGTTMQARQRNDLSRCLPFSTVFALILLGVRSLMLLHCSDLHQQFTPFAASLLCSMCMDPCVCRR